MFDLTYSYRKVLSHIKAELSALQCRLTSEHSEKCVNLKVTKYFINIDKLAKTIQGQNTLRIKVFEKRKWLRIAKGCRPLLFAIVFQIEQCTVFLGTVIGLFISTHIVFDKEIIFTLLEKNK